MTDSSLEYKRLRKQLGWLIAFSIAMGFLEAAVVVYLRLLYYSNGFEFPLVPLDERASVVEIFRELATVIMIIFSSAILYKEFRSQSQKINAREWTLISLGSLIMILSWMWDYIK